MSLSSNTLLRPRRASIGNRIDAVFAGETAVLATAADVQMAWQMAPIVAACRVLDLVLLAAPSVAGCACLCSRALDLVRLATGASACACCASPLAAVVAGGSASACCIGILGIGVRGASMLGIGIGATDVPISGLLASVGDWLVVASMLWASALASATWLKTSLRALRSRICSWLLRMGLPCNAFARL